MSRMWRTDVIWVSGWYIYRTFEDGNLVSELMTNEGDIKGIMDDIGRAHDMAGRYGEVSETRHRADLFNGTYCPS